MPVTGIKDRLMTALHTAVQHFNDSKDPNDAVVKAAQENDFNVEQTTRLAETFNAARTIYHYKTATDRAAEFALADPAAIVPKLYADQEKVAAPEPGFMDYSEYDRPEIDYRDGMQVKTGGLHDTQLNTPTDHPDTSLDTQAKRAFDAVSLFDDMAKTAWHEAGVAGTKAGQLLNKVSTELCRGYIEDCCDQWSRLAGGYAKDAEWAPVMAKLAEHLHPDVAATDPDLSAVVDDRDLGGYVSILKEARDWMQSEAEMLAYSGQLEKEAREFEVEFMSVISGVLPQEKQAAVLNFLDPNLAKRADTTTTTTRKETGVEPLFGNVPYDRETKKVDSPLIGKGVQEGIAEGIKGPIGDYFSTGMAQVMGGSTERDNVALSDRLRNVQRQLLLEDLMTNDPVLADEDPDVVARAYSTLLQVAPDVASNKEIVRATLRQAVHAVATGTYDAQSWVDLEKDLRTIAGKMPFQQPQKGPIA